MSPLRDGTNAGRGAQGLPDRGGTGALRGDSQGPRRLVDGDAGGEDGKEGGRAPTGVGGGGLSGRGDEGLPNGFAGPGGFLLFRGIRAGTDEENGQSLSIEA